MSKIDKKAQKFTETMSIRLDTQTVLKIQKISEENNLCIAELIRISIDAAIPLFRQNGPVDFNAG